MRNKKRMTNEIEKKLETHIKKRYKSETSESGIEEPILEKKTIASKASNFKVRVISSLIMVAAFIAILVAGHFYCCLLVIFINICIFKEIIALKRNEQREAKLPYFSIINWYFFGMTEVILTSLFISHKMVKSHTIDKILKYKYLAMFSMFVLGIVLFVNSLRRGQYKYQFKMFAWTIVTCVLVVSQSTAVILNIYDGIIWLLLPASLVIVNDCSAYIFGILLGKTPLIQLSPNKTVEGFIGGLFSTVVWAYLFSNFLGQFQYLICPQDHITLVPFSWNSCDSQNLLLYKSRTIPFINTVISVSNLEINAMVLGFFAGFIAPFGGFFASGVKRAFKIKDFGDSIPGHGGMTDRMDCQIMMGMFTCVWVHTMLIPSNPSVESLTIQILGLSYSDQLNIYKYLKTTLELKI